MNTLPHEIWWQIFNYYEIVELIELYQHKDSEINEVLSNSYFWFFRFKTFGYRILKPGNSFISWVLAFRQIEYCTRYLDQLSSPYANNSIFFNINEITSLDLLLPLNDGDLNNDVLEILSMPFLDIPISIYFHSYENIISLYLLKNEQSILITDNQELVINTLFNLILKNAYPNWRKNENVT